MQQKNELWKPIKGFEGLYEISNFGRVKSLSRKRNKRGGGFYWDKEKILKDHPTGTNYRFVALCKEGKYKHYQVHRLVAIHFIDNPENKEQVNHLDGSRDNNHVDNLEWCTRAENYHHADSIGRIKDDRNRGENNGLSIMNEKKVLVIRKRREKGDSYKELSNEFNCSIGCIQGIVSRATWKHI